MADEPRRSVRATKGQHTKSHDLLDQVIEPKKKASKKSKKAVEKEEEPEEVIRCVCGALESPPDDPEPWIACDNCGVWQHNVCVGVTTFEDEIPERYLCEQCDPEFHKELLDALKHGVKLWEERRREYERQQAEAEEPKKKGKKKGKRTSDPKSEISHSNGKAKSPSVPVSTDGKKDKKDVIARAGSTKRKTRDDSHDKESIKEPQPKVRKVSALQTPRQPSPPSGLPIHIKELNPSLHGAAMLVQKGLLAAIPNAIKKGLYVLAAGDTVEAKAERLAIQVADAVLAAHPEKTAASTQARNIFSNVKRNEELCSDLLNRKLTPRTLAEMSSDDMASKKQKEETARMKAQSDKQSIMVSDDGPRMRRTHKGEEMIESDDFAMVNEASMSTSRRRSMLDPNADMAARSRENSPGDGVELPDDIESYRSHDDIRAQVQPKHPLNIDTKPLPNRKASAQDNFDIQKVFSNVPSQSPVSAHHNRRQSSINVPPANGPGVDPDIDRMLQDDDGNESPPYSPAEYSSDPDIIWRGGVTMDSIAKFPAVAKHVAGADLSRLTPWSTLIQKELKVAGRIDQEKANEYLCSLRYSPPTDVVIVNITPTGEAAGNDFLELYKYFQGKGKYGVLANKGSANIRDTYLVPVPPSPGQLPDFVSNLEGHRVPESRSEPIILIALVIRQDTQGLSEQGRAPEQPNDMQSPSVVSVPARQMSIGGAGPAMSPIAPQGTFAPQMPHHLSPEEQHRMMLQEKGEAVARSILRQYVDAPTIAFLMPQAYQMRDTEWEVIYKILEEDEKARIDLQHLSQVLEVRMAQQNQ